MASEVLKEAIVNKTALFSRPELTKKLIKTTGVLKMVYVLVWAVDTTFVKLH